MSKEATGVFSHGTHQLTQVKEKAALHVLHDDVDKVLNDSCARLNNRASVSEFKHLDYSRVSQVFEYLNFVIDWNDWFLIAPQELFFENFDRDRRFTWLAIFCEVHLWGVSLATRLVNFVAVVKNRMLGGWLHLSYAFFLG